jgi:glycosyltransferase involved in cell wall biosynthesis
MKVSVIVPTFNSENTLEACLKSIRENKTKYEYEIIICDAGSTDSTLRIARRYADKVLNGVDGRINRNIGIKNANGNIILFTDSDCLVPEDWIDKLVDGLEYCTRKYYRAFGVGGGSKAWLDNPNKVELAIAKAMRSPLISFKARNTACYDSIREVQHNPPINSAYYKWFLDKMGGFNETPYYPEDLDLDTRMIEKGYHLYYLNDVVVKHKHKTTYQGFAKQMWDFGFKRIKIGKYHRSVNKVYHYFPMVLCLMIYSPLFFIPCSLALINMIWIRNIRAFQLTLSFYHNYGMGELKAMLGEKY